jgi:hypothetical protein
MVVELELKKDQCTGRDNLGELTAECKTSKLPQKAIILQSSALQPIINAIGSIEPKVVIRSFVRDVDAQRQISFVGSLREEWLLTVC